ncbi:MAG: lipopolysaccharide heptosyltransferase II, partial [Azonexus sp.]
MKALIVAPSWIGDTIMAQPLFARLHARYPGLQLDALAPRWVAPVLQRMDEITEVVDSPFGHGQLSLKVRWRLARQLAARGYDTVYVLPNSLKSALLPFMAGIPHRVGFTGESRYGLINIRHDLDKAALPLMVERFAQLAEDSGAALPKPVSYPKIRSTAADQEKTLSELKLERPPRIAAFCPGAEFGPAKRWPAAHFAALATMLADAGYAIWLFGSPKDRAVAEDIAQLAED